MLRQVTDGTVLASHPQLGDYTMRCQGDPGLLLNFNGWVNRKDPQGRNVFAGGFLGLDNIGVFDRSAQLPTGGHLDQADGTAKITFCSLSIFMVTMARVSAPATRPDGRGS